MSIFEITSLIFATVGGSGALIVGCGAWLGHVWSRRIAEMDRARHTMEIERLKSDLEIARSQRHRISEAQFRLFTEVWGNLQDLYTMGQRLWERATETNVVAFAEALRKARSAADRGRLILPERHYQDLRALFETFENYQIGKLRLIEFRSHDELKEHYGYSSEDSIRDQVRANADAKKKYERTLGEIVDAFREELGLAREGGSVDEPAPAP